MSKRLRKIVDIKRGDVPRSVYISRILEKNCKGNERESTTSSDMSDQWSLSRRQPRRDSTDPSVLPEERDATNG